MKELTDLDDLKRRQILIRTLDDSTGEGKNICSDHLIALTDNLTRPQRCLAENHVGETRMPTKDLNSARIVNPEYSKHIYESTHGFLLPSGAYICNKCRKDLSETNPAPKRPKLEPKLKVCDKGDTQKAPREEMSPPDTNTPTLGSGESSSEPGSSKSDKTFKPDSQDVQDDRRDNLNNLIKNNFMDERFFQRNHKDKAMDDYSRQTRNKQMNLIASGVEAVINTVSANKPDHIKIFRSLVPYMEERLGDPTTSIDSLLKDVIESYNSCVSNKHRIQVRICFLLCSSICSIY